MITCAFGWEDDPEDCGAPAVILWRAGCAHEHIGDIPICASCRSQVSRSGWDCTRCATAGHDCPMMITELPLSADTGQCDVHAPARSAADR